MAPKTVTKTKKSKANSAKSETTLTAAASGIARPTVSKGNGVHEHIYEDAVKEIVALSENDSYSKKIDGGPLNESRGKDTWRLHTQLRAIDQLDKNLTRHTDGIRESVSAVDEHLHTDMSAISNLLTQARTTVTEKIQDTSAETQARVDSLTKTVKDSFTRLSEATAGSEENLMKQTNAFSKAVEELMASVHSELDKKILEFRDEATRLIDKRFNQSDVAFAAIRADQEVIKALLTDIIKDRLGRPEPRGR